MKWLCGDSSVCLNLRPITSWVSLIYSLSSSYLLCPVLQLNCQLCFLASMNLVLHLQPWHSVQSADSAPSPRLTQKNPVFYSVGGNLNGIEILMFFWREESRYLFWVGPYSILRRKVHINFTLLCMNHFS